MKKIVLAYSGGLDTSVILKWLQIKGYEVIAYVADVGQDEDLDAVKEKALTTGATKVYVEDLKEELVTDYIFPAIKANAIYEGRYLLGTAARPAADRQAAGRDRRRGEGRLRLPRRHGQGQRPGPFRAGLLCPGPEDQGHRALEGRRVPGRVQGPRRPDRLCRGARHRGQGLHAKPYSEDDNLMHISHEAGILEDPALPAVRRRLLAGPRVPQDAPDTETLLEIHFKDGIPVRSSTRPTA